MVVVGIQLLMSCWTEDLSSLLATGQRLPPGSWPWRVLHRVVHNMAASFLRVSKWECKWGSDSKTEIMAFCNLILEVTAGHFYYILWVRIKSLDPAHMQGGEDYTEGGGQSLWGQGAFQMLPTTVNDCHGQLTLKRRARSCLYFKGYELCYG